MAVWNLDDIYSFKDTDKVISGLNSAVDEFARQRENLDSRSAEAFMSLLKKKEHISELMNRLAGYAELWFTENTSDSERTSHRAKIYDIIADAENRILFFDLWFMHLDDKKAEEFIKNSGKYHYVLERKRAFKPYSLKEREEQIINLKDLTGSEALTKLYDMTTNKFKFDWHGKMLSQEVVRQFFQSPEREERKSAYEVVLSKYGDNQDVLAEIYKELVSDWRNENVKVRGFSSPISVRNLSNDIPDVAVEALLSVIRKNVSLFQEYFALKKEVLGLKDRFDLYAPYSSDVKEYPYEESKKMVLDTYKRFDDKAYELARMIFDECHVHSDIVDNKRTGAFCFTVLKDITPYIMLNHVGKLNDLFTMMHEFGHGIHGLMGRGQTQFTFHSALPLAETASVFGEMLLAQRLLKEAGDEEKVAVLMKMLDSQYATIIRQAYFILFEIDAHKMIAEGATLGELNKLYFDNLKEQYGDVLPPDELFMHEWKYIPHIYHTPFYCYAYAFGNLLVLALYKMYEEQGKDFVPKYMKILGYGGSESPAKILEELGIDITKEEFRNAII